MSPRPEHRVSLPCVRFNLRVMLQVLFACSSGRWPLADLFTRILLLHFSLFL